MGRYDQAPRLINKKPKMDSNIIMISNEMYTAIFNAVGRKYQAGALMVWLIGQADGFGIALETVKSALGMDKNGYYKSRSALEELGFIMVIDGGSITINYNKILGNEKDDSKNRVMKKMSHSFDDPILGNEKDDSILIPTKDDSKIGSSKVGMGNEKDDPIFLGNEKDDPMGNEKDDPMSNQKWEYNIEEHIKTYKESQEKLGNEKDDPILSNEKDDSILSHQKDDPILGNEKDYPILTIENFKTTVYQNNYLDEYNSTGAEILDSYDFNNDSEVEEMSNEFPEAYSDLVRLGMIKRKSWVF